MFFAKLATVAVIAFGTFVAATPVEVKKRADSVTSILDALTEQVAPLAAQFGTPFPLDVCASPDVASAGTLDASSASGDSISPIVDQIQSAVSSAVDQINALPPGTTADSSSLTSLSNVISTIVTPANGLSQTQGVDSKKIIPFFSPLGVVLALLVKVVLKLVVGLLVVVEATLVTLLGGLIVVLSHLNLTPLLLALGVIL
ncbi:hypothetical protein FA95DRAFT_692504 [Auriscalpium vulgare]|uniref:Uncharacterized protein n=1 Tax=Auriscalpium vulgare TaxID=40419 RepID=A0ACB8RCZ3_9AGAM|nr:hypothetical protein FA95DRAFT_692504 [Auriscalpium vulgare]